MDALEGRVESFVATRLPARSICGKWLLERPYIAYRLHSAFTRISLLQHDLNRSKDGHQRKHKRQDYQHTGSDHDDRIVPFEHLFADQKGNVPAQVKVSTRSSGWFRSEINSWVMSRLRGT
jgi:hypothetical protein